MTDVPRARLSDGSVATIEPDRFIPGTFQLVVDGTPQSHVHLDRPTELFFEYVQRIGHVIDQIEPVGGPITAIHLGAGALTLPRYIAATRPGSTQHVIELEPELVALVREYLPLPRGAAIRVRYGDAREVVGRLPAGLQGKADLIISDIFRGSQTPAHVTAVGYFQELSALLAPDGVVVVNVADGNRLEFARRHAATLKEVFREVIILVEPGVLKGGRVGNLVFAARNQPLASAQLARLAHLGPFPAKVVSGTELDQFIAGARPIQDNDGTRPPTPPKELFG